jgi:5,6,7,8-tetrahydromethanopterin hydro-lyase
VIDAGEADDVVLVVAVWVNPAAADEEAVYTNNAEATLAALAAARDGIPSVAAVLDAGDPANPYFRTRAERGPSGLAKRET